MRSTSSRATTSSSPISRYPSTPAIYRRLQETKGVEFRIVKHRAGAGGVRFRARCRQANAADLGGVGVPTSKRFRHEMRPLAVPRARTTAPTSTPTQLQAIGTAAARRPLGRRRFPVLRQLQVADGRLCVAPFFVNSGRKPPIWFCADRSRLACREAARRLPLRALSQRQEIRIRQPGIWRALPAGGRARLSRPRRPDADRNPHCGADGTTAQRPRRPEVQDFHTGRQPRHRS